VQSRRQFLGIVGAAACGVQGGRLTRSLGTVLSAATGRPPNVVLVLTDDQGYGDLACHGNPILRTPNIDENMGRLLDKLKTLGLEENTILIFMTDNGTAAGFQGGRGFNAGMRGTKGSQYDGGHRVPCFVRWPAGGLGGGKDVTRLTAHIDLLPTLIAACGLATPVGARFDGTSLVPLLRGQEGGWPDRILITDSQRIEHPEKWRQSAVMTDRWRLINGRELYDIRADRGQKNDISGEHPEAVKSLREACEKWWGDVSPRFDEYCEIVIGSDRENPTRLTADDGTSRGEYFVYVRRIS